MMRSTQLTAAWLCLLVTASTAQTQDTKWSRQLDTVGSSETDSLDWVPLAQAIDSSKDRSANGRVLSYSPAYTPNARFGELSKAPQSSSSGFDFPYQFQRFSHSAPQAQPLRHVPHSLKSGAGQEPTSQSFFKFEMPFRNEAGAALRAGAQVPPTLQTGYQIQHSFGGAPNGQASFFNAPSLFGQQQSLFGPDFNPIPPKPLPQALTQPHKPLHQQNFVEDTLPLKPQAKPTQPSLNSVTPQVFPHESEPETLPSAASAQATANNQQQEVQLLYVPYDTLYNQQRQQQQQGSSLGNNYNVNKYNFNAGLPAVNPYQINQFYTQDPTVGSDYFNAATTTRPSTTTAHAQNVFQSYAQPQFTTAKPKPKAHQPPLAMFLLRSNSRPTQSDVVAALRNAHSISVIDAPTKQTPDIFVGPSGMPIPDGYVKFDLPYLSQLAHSRDLEDVPFFVAPLSYRTPSGFNKILLPEPHVGSIVVNRAKDTATFAAPEPAQPARPQRPYTASSAAPSSTRNPFETTTQRGTGSPAPGRGNKFSYFYVQDAIQEVTSPKIAKQERPKKKRPQTNVQIEQPTYRPPAKNQFETINQIGQDDFFNSFTRKPSSTSTSTTSSTSTSTSTTSTTSTTAAPQTLFTYSTSPQVEFPSTNGQLYHQFDTAPQVQPIQEQLPRFTTRPPAVTTADEEYHMKQYFRQQDAFRQRPYTTNPPFEQVEYTPAADFGQEAAVPSTTQKISSKGKHRVNIYTPATVAVTSSDVGYNVESNKQLPLNHRPSYNQNEVLDATNVDYEPNPYHVPSELPALTPDIPGLVNNLQEKDKLPATTTPLSEPEVDTRPTRRPLRTRKPLVSKVSSSVSYSESESSSKLPSHRIRRPYGTRVSASTGSGDNSEDTATTTRSPPRQRNPLLRNPNRVRYQPTPEERQTLKLKPKKHYTGSKNKGKQNEDQDLEYQRDVLKQNYPVFKSQRRPTSPTAIPSSYDVAATEGPASESQQVYTVTPSNSIDNTGQDVFPASLLEPMQIAQHYNDFSKDNYGPGYFPNQEDLNPTEAIVRNEVNPVYTAVASTAPPATTTTTTTRTTTEAPPTTTTRRSPFVRRNYPRLRTTTTTEVPQTTTSATEERATLRPRVPPRRVVKVRQRTRRPQHPASSTNAPEEEAESSTQKPFVRKLSRYNQEPREKEVVAQTPRRRYKKPFQLEGQESQWSAATEKSNSVANTNSFKPLNPKQANKPDTHSFENEPEIVTAGPTDQAAETYEINVSANLSGSADKNQQTTLKAPNLKPEKSFAELLEEVMGKAPEELATEYPSSTNAAQINRRGKWKKTRIASAAENAENFETAESQNLGPQLYNALYANGKAEDSVKTTTPLTPATESTETTTAAAPTTPEEYEVTTAKMPETTVATTAPLTEVKEESATRRMDTLADVDDLETQPSIFSEVKKQLHDLFAIEESEDQAATAALAAVGKRRQEYTNIKRTKAPETTTQASTEPTSDVVATTVTSPLSDKKDNFHKDLMEHVVYATSTSTKVTSETEICYRGRCIRSEDLPANHKLH